jgi:uncharacterized YccA/Bax inhibitor family protein
MRTGNPAFTMGGNIFQDWAAADARRTSMTVSGTATKAVGMLVLLTISAGIAWTQMNEQTISGGMLIGSVIGGLVFAMATCFKPNWAPVTAPLYAIAEGFFLGAISNLFNQRYPGIAVQAVSLTFSTMFVMLFMYSTRIIRVTDQLRSMVVAATGGVLLVYVVSWILGFFGVQVPFLHGNGLVSIGVSVVIVGIAAFNLLLDFDFIETQSAHGAPKSMEWYGAFGLMVTLVWMYLEILRLLAKLQSRD